MPRTSLIGKLLGSRAALVVVCAPAGWGKTTLLTQWADRDPRTTAWLQLDAADNDALVLLTYLALALEHLAPLDPRVFRWLESPAPPVTERILPAFATALGVAPPFLLVLDDAHLLTNASCWQIVGFVQSQLPAGAQLALGTRSQPGLPLPRLRAEGRLLELGISGLALDARETGELLRLRGLAADDEAAAALQEATEGWAAGVSLAALAAQAHAPSQWPMSMRAGQREIAEYLTAEVLERQPRSLRRFLTQTSILGGLSVDLCRAVTAASDSETLLGRLVRDNLFVSALDDRGEWYRYHHLFAELLRSELAQRDGARIPELHRRAAAWYEEHARPEEALHHWLAAGEVEPAAAIVCHARSTMAGEGRLMGTLRRWLDLFSDEQILSNAALTLTAGWLYPLTEGGRATHMWNAIARGDQFDDRPSLDGSVSLRSSQVSLRAGAAPDGVARMVADAQLGADLEAQGRPEWRTGSLVILGAARWLAGDNAGAWTVLRTALDEAHGYNIVAELGALGHLSLLEADEAHWREAEHYALEANRLLDGSGFGEFGPALPARCAQARMLAHSGDPAVETLLASIAAERERIPLPQWIRLYTAVILGEIALERGDLAAVERWVAEGFTCLAGWPDAGVLGPRLAHLRRALEERLGIEPLTAAEERLLTLLPTRLTEKAMARKLGLSINTVKSHVHAVYRKLEVTCRADAVERARKLGLLTR